MTLPPLRGIMRLTFGPLSAGLVLLLVTGCGGDREPSSVSEDPDWEAVVKEDFSAGKLPEGWEITSGKAEVVGGALVVEGKPEGGGPESATCEFTILLPGACPDAVRLEYDAWFPRDVDVGPNADLSALLHADVQKPGYLVQFGGRGNRATRILANGVDLVQTSDTNVRIVGGKRYHIVAEHVGQFVRMQVDSREVLRLRDFFPLSGGRAGLYSWGKGARFDNVRLSRRREAPPSSKLAEADKLYLAGDYVGANKLYVGFRVTHADDAEAPLALYKSGLSLMNQSDTEGAQSAFETLQNSELGAWAELALAEVEARRGKGEEAVKHLCAASASADRDAAALVRSSIIYLGLRTPASRGVDAAVPILQEARKFLPDWQYEWLANETAGTGDYTRTHGRIDLAVNFYAAALRAFPDVRDACADSLLGLGLASLEHAPDKPDIAIKAFERVLSEYPEQTRQCTLVREKLAELAKKKNAPPPPK